MALPQRRPARPAQARCELDYLFIDTHPGVNEETLLSIAVSDLLILIVRPDQQDFQGTAVTVELARKLDVPEMFLLINKVPPGMDVVALREQVEAMYQAEVAAIVLPLNTEMVRLGQRRHLLQSLSRPSAHPRAARRRRAHHPALKPAARRDLSA